MGLLAIFYIIVVIHASGPVEFVMQGTTNLFVHTIRCVFSRWLRIIHIRLRIRYRIPRIPRRRLQLLTEVNQLVRKGRIEPRVIITTD